MFVPWFFSIPPFSVPLLSFQFHSSISFPTIQSLPSSTPPHKHTLSLLSLSLLHLFAFPLLFVLVNGLPFSLPYPFFFHFFNSLNHSPPFLSHSKLFSLPFSLPVFPLLLIGQLLHTHPHWIPLTDAIRISDYAPPSSSPYLKWPSASGKAKQLSMQEYILASQYSPMTNFMLRYREQENRKTSNCSSSNVPVTDKSLNKMLEHLQEIWYIRMGLGE